MSDNVYRKLAEHLDRLPGGFPPSEAGAEITLLKRLFMPEEAELATHLTVDREEAGVIAERAGLDPAETEKRLSGMARKGLVFSVEPEDGPVLYQAAPFVVGIYEFQVNNLTEGLVKDLADYWSTQKKTEREKTIRQIRTIPVEESIKPQLEALPYERVHEIVRSQKTFAVAPCICRRHAKLLGGGCDAPEEACLLFGEWAEFYVRGGWARMIDRSEVLEILARADEANLVLQPSNTRESVFICCCCSCCCGVLQGLQKYPKPAEAATSSFIARFDPDACSGCMECLERCQMQALSEDGERVSLNRDRCIGCGLCVTTCPTGALTLERKPGTDKVETPGTIDAVWHIMAKARASEQ
jgi:Na+-translocating ferredoxin:NAD+ oxidoreductase RNF subunit RnfB